MLGRGRGRSWRSALLFGKAADAIHAYPRFGPRFLSRKLHSGSAWPWPWKCKVLADTDLMRALSETVDFDALCRWMDEQCIGHGPLEGVEPLGGGTQNILIRFRRDGQPYVLRRGPPDLRHGSNQAMSREAQMLAALDGTGIPHPNLVALCKDESVIGAVFFLMESIKGVNAVESGLPAEARRRAGLEFIEAVANLGEIAPETVGLSGFGQPEGFLGRQAGRWMGQLESYAKYPEWPGTSDLPDPEPIARWLEDNCPAETRPGILHGDCHFANAMFDPESGELMALIDWEMSTLGDPLLDLGWTIATWPGEDYRMFELGEGYPKLGELIAAYAARSTRSMDSLPWYGVCACFKLGSILEGTYARALAGRAPLVVGKRLHDLTQMLFGRAERLMSGNLTL